MVSRLVEGSTNSTSSTLPVWMIARLEQVNSLHWTCVKSPIGPLLLAATHKGLCAVEYTDEGRLERLKRRLTRWYQEDPEPGAANLKAVEHLQTTRLWLAAYFEARFDRLHVPALDHRGTAFERNVWACLLTVPAGKLESYGGLAERLGRPQGARAVGAAVGRNSINLVVPCHRIVATGGALTGYGGGLGRKQFLLAHEHPEAHTTSSRRSSA